MDWNVPLTGKAKPKYDFCALNKLCSKISYHIFLWKKAVSFTFKCATLPYSFILCLAKTMNLLLSIFIISKMNNKRWSWVTQQLVTEADICCFLSPPGGDISHLQFLFLTSKLQFQESSASNIPCSFTNLLKYYLQCFNVSGKFYLDFFFLKRRHSLLFKVVPFPW